MPIAIEQVRDRLGALADKGKALIDGRHKSEFSNQEMVDTAGFREWRVGCVAFLREALGPESPYAKEFEFNCDSPFLSAVVRGMAVLRATREYIEFGPVARVEELVAAEIFTDLIGIASRLLREGRHNAAVIIAAAVLEDVMRRSARHRQIPIRENVDNLLELNARMVAGGAYPPTLGKRIEEWAQLRARAEALVLDADERPALEAFIKGVRDFVNDHLF
ncbi:MAG TPA: hypothetical protein VFB15_10615 [Candidatus Binataceae bacterium]|jgi:hypothetical protein|nr:hypothetical protein [Candidatus Binataceae bacterium]